MKKIFLVLSLLVFFAGSAFAADDLATLQAKAEKGDAVAQYNLGSRYFNGTGVRKSDTDAANWWRRAAKQGDHGAQLQLGHLYDDGHGVEHDDRKAYFWYSLAMNDPYPRISGPASAGHDRMAKKLSAAEVADADKAIAAWKPAAEPPQ